MNLKDITITSLETITAFDVLTGNYKFTLDELQSASIAQSQEASEVTGKAGRKIATLKRNKSVKISGNNGLVSGGLMEIQTGSDFEHKASEVLWTDYLTVNSGAATTNYKAVGTVGAEITSVYIKNDSDNTLGTQLTQDSKVEAGKFTYDPATKALSFHTDIKDGTEIVVYYKRKIAADVLENQSDSFSGKCSLFIDAYAEDKCSNVYRVQIYIPKADFSGEFTLDMGDNQTVHAFEAEALAGACGSNGNLWTYTIFADDAEDAAADAD